MVNFLKAMRADVLADLNIKLSDAALPRFDLSGVGIFGISSPWLEPAAVSRTLGLLSGIISPSLAKDLKDEESMPSQCDSKQRLASDHGPRRTNYLNAAELKRTLDPPSFTSNQIAWLHQPLIIAQLFQ